MSQFNLAEFNSKIQLLKKTAEELLQQGSNFPAISRNIVRILASVKMLEINVSDVIELDR